MCHHNYLVDAGCQESINRVLQFGSQEVKGAALFGVEALWKNLKTTSFRDIGEVRGYAANQSDLFIAQNYEGGARQAAGYT